MASLFRTTLSSPPSRKVDTSRGCISTYHFIPFFVISAYVLSLWVVAYHMLVQSIHHDTYPDRRTRGHTTSSIHPSSMSAQQKSVKAHSGPPPRQHGGSSHQHNKRPPTGGKYKKPFGSPKTVAAATHHKPQDKEKYVVIITNVENDFGRLHDAVLPYYCGFRGDFEETPDVDRVLTESKGSENNRHQMKKLVCAKRGCSYAVRCRTETRSAEVSLYGPAEADFSAMQMHKEPRPPRSTNNKAEKAAPISSLENAVDAITTATPATTDTPVDRTGAPHPETEQGATLTECVATTPKVNAVEALALLLRRKHYFEDRLPVHVHLPGRAAGELLVRIGGSTTEAAKAETQKERAVPVGQKRARDEKEEGEREKGDGVDDALSESSESETAGEEKDGAHQDASKKAQPRHLRQEVLRQFPSRQKDFVTAVAELSARVPLRVVRRRLHDVPGYLSCWSLYEKHVRLVFRDAESLFKAKQLLDQFELQPGLRLAVSLSDALSRANAEFVTQQAAKEEREAV